MEKEKEWGVIRTYGNVDIFRLSSLSWEVPKIRMAKDKLGRGSVEAENPGINLEERWAIHGAA